MKKLLLTGGAGFIGSQLTEVLLANGNFEVTCIDNFDLFYPRAHKEKNIAKFLNHPRYKFIEGDITNEEDLKKLDQADVIIHLAAKAGVRQSIIYPVQYQDINVAGTQNVLEYARVYGVKQFIFASSSSVYGINANMPWAEDQGLLPISPYAASKLSGEMLGHVYSHLYKIRFISLRFFTVYGPGQRPDLAIHQFFHSILNAIPISVYGDGNSSRDYTFIGDMIAGIIAAIEYSTSDFEIINLGNHKVVPLMELIQAIEHTCGKKAIIRYCCEQPGDVKHTFADISKARQLLSYNPTTSLEQGLKAFYDWYLNNL